MNCQTIASPPSYTPTSNSATIIITTRSGVITYWFVIWRAPTDPPNPIWLTASSIGSECVQKITINNTINLVFFKIAISILLISNHNSFRVLFDKIASVYFIWKYIFIFQHWKWPAQGTSTVPIVSAHFRSLCASFWAASHAWHKNAACCYRRTSAVCLSVLWSRFWALQIVM